MSNIEVEDRVAEAMEAALVDFFSGEEWAGDEWGEVAEAVGFTDLPGDYGYGVRVRTTTGVVLTVSIRARVPG